MMLDQQESQSDRHATPGRDRGQSESTPRTRAEWFEQPDDIRLLYQQHGQQILASERKVHFLKQTVSIK